ncbi:hypothetical protein ACFU6K_36290 [Kitasatospora sp. NPDC057512]|uniref:hypothetical protein n=1 Tax=Kitasatospora sp. NPDC057512 TaxID=3346154 RepID=UPI0036BB93A2
MKPLVLTALAVAVAGVLASGTVAAVADGKPSHKPVGEPVGEPVGKPVGTPVGTPNVKPTVVVPHGPAAVSPALMAAHDQVVGDWIDVDPGANGVAVVSCPSGEVPTGGGGQTSAYRIFFTDSYPTDNSWVVRGTNTGTATESIRATAVCTAL